MIKNIKRFYLLFIYLLISNLQVFSQKKTEQWEDYYNKAKVATYYSASVLNGYYDLKLAFTYLDSTKQAINVSSLSVQERTRALGLVSDLALELNVSKGIAMDNMNYKYPVFSVMTGHRTEFNKLDDTEELLIEAIIERVLNSPDPIWKGNLRDNTHFVLVNVTPFNESQLTVALDYLASNTGFNAIRIHDLKLILGKDGYKRYVNNIMDSTDYNALMTAFSIDKMICFNIKDNGSGMNALFYKGVTLNLVNKVNCKPTYITYYESFKRDKKNSGTLATYVYLINTAIFIIILILISGYKKVGNKFQSKIIITKENFKSTCILIVATIISVFISFFLSKAINTEINLYYEETSAYIWLIYQILAPTFISVIVSYLLLFKFSNEVVNSKQIFSRILYTSFVFPMALISYFEIYAEPFPKNIFYYINIVQPILFVPTAILGGIVINGIIKKESIEKYKIIFFIVAILLWLIGVWGDLKDDLYITILPIISSSIISSISFINIKKYRKEILTEKTDSTHSLLNPYSYFKEGLNLNELESEIKNLMEDRNRSGLIVSGEFGIGKSRYIYELSKNNSKRTVYYIGDCNEYSEGNNQLYEPFYNAFCQHSYDNVSNLSKGFFTDRTGISKNLNKVVKMAGSASPLDVSDILIVEDDGKNKSVQEIASELIEVLIKRNEEYNFQSQVIIIDDFQWIDPSTFDLFMAFVNQIEIRSKITKNIKIVLFVDSNLPKDSQVFNFIEEKKPNGYSNFNLSITNHSDFVNSIINNENLKIYGENDNKYIFTPLLKAHLRSICLDKNIDFTPGDFFGYLASLQSNDYLKIDGKALRLVQEPEDSDKINLKSGRSKVFSNAFENLNSEDQLFLESAAHIGFKFDADILASIWNMDIINALRTLERLEAEGFVTDLHEVDNLFSFKNKELHKIIRIRNNKNEDNDQTVKQLVIEYQKRIIKTIVNKGEDYISTLDLDILQSAIHRCFKYNKVELIKNNTPLIGLYAAKKYIEHGKVEKAAEIVLKIYPMITYFEDKHINLIAGILSEVIDYNTLENFDKEILYDNSLKKSSDKINFIEDIVKQSLKSNQINQFEEITNSIMRDCFKRRNSLKDTNLNRINFLNSYKNNFKNQASILRFEYYMELLTNADGLVLKEMLKNSISNHHYTLAGEIARHLSLISRDSLVDKFYFASLSLILIIEKYELLKDSKYIVNITAPEIKKYISELFKKENLNHKKAHDLNYTISRFRDYYFEINDYDSCIFFCQLAMDLSAKLNDNQGCKLAFSFHGASLFKKRLYSESLSVYKAYFEFLITKTKVKSEFTYVIEGIGLNCQAINDFTEYNKLKVELYEHLLYVSQAMKEEPLKFSLFDKTKKLKDIIFDADVNSNNALEDEEWNAHNTISAHKIVDILVCLSLSEGEVDINERHDISESAIALSYTLNIPHESVKKYLDKSFNLITAMNENEKEIHFKQCCSWLKANENIHFSKAVINLCEDLIVADGIITPQEKHYMELANSILN